MASVTPPGLAYEVEHDLANHRFQARVQGHLALLDYQIQVRRRRKHMVITHTEVPEPIAGRGIAGELTKVALRYAREHKFKVVPACAYAEAFMQRHEEYDDLLAG
ncbi:GNAT family N-acetyltransferase [Stenotrophomonas rhizophila]|uniref:GNAT family N-acetyltransferase n=1 Tax=Stenotrophomonas rhizophila TaxID=216778 RepID=UPI001E4EC72A|nr:GNAT family N-acetyltransferase [Stenotrophomonas rhizophila]MCC7635226.1 N-acetyltransferase [Stenotrophomonas rhizophila]MCC7664559.1 N-acetyltransferase [Stenotrophomonas rhizophila]